MPLLKQLIAMLEQGGPFTLSSDLLNIIQGGDLNIYGGQQAQHTTTKTTTHKVKERPAPAEIKKEEVQHVQASAGDITLPFFTERHA